MSTEQRKRDIVIIGGGIIGCTTAYFLSHHERFNKDRDSITLLEATEIAGGASGKAGGLLALWAYPSCIVPLSYRLHKELADKHNGSEQWGYRAVHCGQLDAQGRNPSSNSPTKKDSISLQKQLSQPSKTASNLPQDLDWISPSTHPTYTSMGDPSTTAQVHPYQFTTSMARLASEAGVKIIHGTARHIKQNASDAVASVSYISKDDNSDREISADTVILTAGPWTSTIYPKAPIEALRAHSVTIKPTRPVSAYALFTEIRLPDTTTTKKGRRRSSTATPEIYARPNNQVYACGSGDTLIPLPDSTDLVQVDDSRCQQIIEQVGSISDELRDGEVTARQACYLPNVRGGGGPLVGETGVEGLLIGAGHTCWGIQNGPGTGACLSELVWEGRVQSAEVGELDPRGFM